MFRISNEFGNIPYDGFVITSRQFPWGEFIRWARQQEGYHWRDPKKNKKGWENFVALRINGAAGALKVRWRPLMTGRNMPMTMIYCNPSTAGLSPNETLALLRWVTPTADDGQVGEMATKLDFEGVQREHDARIYLPKIRAENRQYEGETHYHGSRRGVQLKTYDKGRESGGRPHEVVRVETIEHHTNSREKNLRRPTTVELLRGDRIGENAFRRAMVVDLAAMGDQALTERALKVGLSEALRVGHLPKTGNRGANMGWLRRRVNDNADKDLLFNLYREQAEAWHSQFNLATVDSLCVVWSDEQELKVVPGLATSDIPT